MGAYETKTPAEAVSATEYPGRGIIIGRTADGKKSALAYFIMGRSQNSRNRVFTETSDGIRTQACDPLKLTDPGLVIYNPIRYWDSRVIVSNGNQTDTIKDYLSRGESFESALKTRDFEPDAPHFTPRISGLLYPDASYKLSIIKSADASGTACERNFFEYPGVSGVGHYIHTYAGDGNPLPCFNGEPERISIPDSADALAEELWYNLNYDNKVSLYVFYADWEADSANRIIINKNKIPENDANGKV